MKIKEKIWNIDSLFLIIFENLVKKVVNSGFKIPGLAMFKDQENLMAAL